MIEAIYEAPMVIADITCHNPNVFYELGVRHALRKNGTILTIRKGGDIGVRKGLLNRKDTPDNLPFDINDVRHHAYYLSQGRIGEEIKKLAESILNAERTTTPDSPVFHHIPGLRIARQSEKAASNQGLTYEIVSSPGRYVGFRSGDIEHLRGENAIDYWVNSENTLMQMARMFERSISSTIRFLGALNPEHGSSTFDDTIANALQKALGNRSRVEEGDILVTTSGRLAHTHGVKAIIHAASVTGSPRMGWRPLSRLQLCDLTRHVIHQAREISKGPGEFAGGRSVVMPLFGAGQAGQDPQVMVPQLIQSVIETLSSDVASHNGHAGINLVVFIASSRDNVELLRRMFAACEADGDLRQASKDISK